MGFEEAEFWQDRVIKTYSKIDNCKDFEGELLQHYDEETVTSFDRRMRKN